MKYPHIVRTTGLNGKVYTFDMVAPITGDGIYKTTTEKGVTYHAVVPNPDARDHQARRLLRGI
jgi:hypothetical protein